MKQAFKFVLNLLSFGIPLLLRVLSRSRKFTKILNHQVEVVLVSNSQVEINIGSMNLLLEIDSNKQNISEERKGGL